jgi:hypothetical protein
VDVVTNGREAVERSGAPLRRTAVDVLMPEMGMASRLPPEICKR